jgi:integrating conjugative element protein (TIGR03752 family)
MTALMGVVPNKNNAVKNLMRFKVITGSENIASNGLFLPDVRNIIWTGYAIGNREMECVQATVDTITFTFKDGTIRTVKQKQGASTGQLNEGLGYLSDRWGKPCIKGTLISNAAQYLRDRMIAAGAAATASASAAMQTTTSRDALGGSSTTVTGSEGDYIAGQTGTATLNELAAYLRDRMDQAVDIVYLDAGKDVVIHVEKQVDIDYDPAGRKLSHIALSQHAARASKARLD